MTRGRCGFSSSSLLFNVISAFLADIPRPLTAMVGDFDWILIVCVIKYYLYRALGFRFSPPNLPMTILLRSSKAIGSQAVVIL